jgi:hypothetical protein
MGAILTCKSKIGIGIQKGIIMCMQVHHLDPKISKKLREKILAESTKISKIWH